MNRNRVKLTVGLHFTSVLLAFVLVACGGDEPFAVVPPPAPPPFQPQAVEVALGASGQSITLITTEASGFTLNGEAVSSGDTYTADNGNYTLILSGGTWTAEFVPNILDVTLGASGDSVTIVQLELGGFSLNGEPITADTTTTATNGATYGVTLGEDGIPAAVYIPTSVSVALGMYGGELALTLAEDQLTYMRNGEALMSGTVVVSNQREYTVSMVEGEWTAEFIRPMPVVRLGQSGMTVTLIQDEAMAWWIDPETPLANGDTHTAGANDYTLTLAGGMWSAAFVPRSIEVPLGMSGESVTVTQVETGGYTFNERMVGGGAYALATNGARYSLQVGEDGVVTASYISDPVTVMLGTEGGTITLVLQEDQMTWLLEGETEPFTSGRVISIESIGNSYTVTLGEDDIWTAVYNEVELTVDLGTSGDVVVLIRDEVGGYRIDGTAIESGHTYIAANGNYTLTKADGIWTAVFDPAMHDVPLGASGDRVTAVQLELGGFSLYGKPITADTTTTATNGATYGVMVGEDGMPVAVYIPTSVSVVLGSYGGELELALAEDQMTYTLNGEAFMSGTVVASNERGYTVSMVDGEWTAEFIRPMPVVRLGQSGMTVTLIQDEAMAWWIDPETPLANGDIHTAGPNDYTLTLAGGMWSATFVPRSMEVPLGMSGERVTVTQVEAGGYTFNERMVGDGAYAMATNGARYSLHVGEDGTVKASYISDPVTVMLGTEGGTITLVLQEDQMTWLLEGEIEPFMSGRVINIEGIGNTYTVTLGEDDVWTAVYNEVEVTVDLGTSGDVVTLIRDETGGWRTDPETPIRTGETRTARNGNVYKLTFEGGEWTDAYVPVTKEIPGTGLTAVRNEDQAADPGYRIMEEPGQKLDANGLGTIASTAGNFRVHMDAAGNLVALQYEEPVNGKNDGKAGYSIGGVSVIGDNAETVPNEAGTMITIDGINHATGELFNTGRSTVEGDTIVPSVREEVSLLTAQIKGLIAVNEVEGDDRTDFTQAFNDKWEAIDAALNRIFGDADDDDATLDHLADRPRRVEDMVAMLDAIVAALSDVNVFASAMEEGGVFEGLIPDSPSSRIPEVFNAVVSTATAYLARTEDTRYGLFTNQERSVADSTFDDPLFGVFAYSPMKATRSADLPTLGGASYSGRTMAVDGTGKTIYNGDISLQVHFRAKRLSGLIRNLKDADGHRFELSSGTVAAIIFPAVTIRNDGSFIRDGERPGQIVFTANPGSLPTKPLSDRQVDGADVAGSSFAGQFVADGTAAIGTWATNASDDDPDNLTGAFGVQRGEEVTDQRPEVSGGGTSRTSLDGAAQGVSEVNAMGVITLAPGLIVPGADLFESGGATISGKGFVEGVVKDIQSEFERLDTFIELDELGEETAADNGRTAVWAALATALDALVGSGNGSQIFASGDYVTTNDDDAVADDSAREKIAKVLEALSSRMKFRSAVQEGGILYGNSGLITGDNAAIDAVFERVMSTATVKYGTTRYTRFGAWNRVGTTEAATVPSNFGLDPADGVFAYSPLAATAYNTYDPNFPAGLRATYEGTTIARGDNDGSTYYQGSITIDVTWAASLSDAANVGDISASITDLRTSSGASYMSGGNAVESIQFTAADFKVARNSDTSVLFFDSGTTAARLRFADLRIVTTEASATMGGIFVGKVIDGPLAVIGNWSLENSNGDDLAGAYGADLVP